MVISFLTSTGYSPFHAGRMPRTNTSHFPKTTVRFAWKTRYAPPADNTLIAAASCSAAYINDLTLRENFVDWDFLWASFYIKQRNKERIQTFSNSSLAKSTLEAMSGPPLICISIRCDTF